MNRLIHQDVAHRVFKVGEPISLRKQVTPLGPQGAPYNVVNTLLGPPLPGQFFIPPSGLTLSIHEIDTDGNNHQATIAAMDAGDHILLDDDDVVLTGAPIYNTGVFSLQVNALPVAVDGQYIVRAIRL